MFYYVIRGPMGWYKTDTVKTTRIYTFATDKRYATTLPLVSAMLKLHELRANGLTVNLERV